MSGSVRIKFCGIRTPEDAVAAVSAGADLIGVNFIPGSPREVDIPTAIEICKGVEDLPVERVALFRDGLLQAGRHGIEMPPQDDQRISITLSISIERQTRGQIAICHMRHVRSVIDNRA